MPNEYVLKSCGKYIKLYKNNSRRVKYVLTDDINDATYFNDNTLNIILGYGALDDINYEKIKI